MYARPPVFYVAGFEPERWLSERTPYLILNVCPSELARELRADSARARAGLGVFRADSAQDYYAGPHGIRASPLLHRWFLQHYCRHLPRSLSYITQPLLAHRCYAAAASDAASHTEEALLHVSKARPGTRQKTNRAGKI
jgi:hypothetical protein